MPPVSANASINRAHIISDSAISAEALSTAEWRFPRALSVDRILAILIRLSVSKHQQNFKCARALRDFPSAPWFSSARRNPESLDLTGSAPGAPWRDRMHQTVEISLNRNPNPVAYPSLAQSTTSNMHPPHSQQSCISLTGL